MLPSLQALALESAPTGPVATGTKQSDPAASVKRQSEPAAPENNQPDLLKLISKPKRAGALVRVRNREKEPDSTGLHLSRLKGYLEEVYTSYKTAYEKVKSGGVDPTASGGDFSGPFSHRIKFECPFLPIRTVRMGF